MNADSGKILKKYKTVEAITKPAVKLSTVEKRALNWWCHAHGSMADFLDFASGDERYLAVLTSEPVRKWVEYLSRKGICLPLSANKDELAVRMTAVLRDRSNNSQTLLLAATELAKLQGFYPDKGNGGVNVQIVLTEGLGG